MTQAVRAGTRIAVVAAAALLAALPVAAQADQFGGLIGVAPPPVKCGPAPCSFAGGSGAQQRVMANATDHEVRIVGPHVVRVGEDITVTIAANPNSTTCQGFIPFANKVSFHDENTATATCVYRAATPTNFQEGDTTGPAWFVYDRFPDDRDHDYYAIVPADRFELAGRIRVAGEPPEGSVTLEIDGGTPPAPRTVATNSDGDYSTVLPQGTYTVTPQVGGAVPATRTVNLTTHARDVDFALGDADGDGLLDAWETEGLDVDGDEEVDLDLPAMGADPQHKDIFIEVDAMEHHAVSQEAVDMMVAAFAAAPVPNPDKTTGITLHVDNGFASTMDPRTGDLWGIRSDADQVFPHDDALGAIGPDGDYDWTEFDAIKAANFADARRPVFHYVVSGHGFPDDDPAAGAFTLGVSRGEPASDVLLTTDSLCPHCTVHPTEQAPNFMHELGHNLGLRHGGGDQVNYKPNYLSVMNYSFALRGLLRSDFATRALDFDHFGAPAIDEAQLDEAAGLGVDAQSPAAQFAAIFGCADGKLRSFLLTEAPVNFDCDATIDGQPAAVDLNRDGTIGRLEPFDDWANLKFTGGAIGDLNAAPLPVATQVDEPTLDELLEAEAALTTPPNNDPGGGSKPPPTGAPPVAAPPPSPPVAGAAPPRRAAALPSNAFTIARRVRRLRDGRVEITVAVPGRGRIDARATARVTVARRRTVTVARARVSAARAGSVKVRLRPSRALLRRRRSLKTSVRVTFTPTGGTAATRSLTVTFRRRP